jgi:DNA polymerase-4
MHAPAGILHADLDAFYASVEQLLNPDLRGKPVAVGGSVVLAASYEARALGVRGDMPGFKARALCPDLIVVPGRFAEYQRFGDAAIAIMHDYTPHVERISIDEAFADVSGSTRLFGPPDEIARTIRRRVRDELGLPISIGVARTKHLAKIASKVAKPDGLVIVAPEEERAFLDPLPVKLMWGVGPVTQARLAGAGVTTIGQFAAHAPQAVERLLGRAHGRKLSSLATNEDARKVEPRRLARSVGAQSALGRKPPLESVYRPVLLHLAERIATRLRAKDRPGRTVTVRVRFGDFRAVTRARTLPAPILATVPLAAIATDLVRAILAAHPQERVITLVGISVSALGGEDALQLDLPLGCDEAARPGALAGQTRERADRALDAIRNRFGRDAIAYAAAHDRPRSVPDAFRELAEKEI